MVSLCKTGGISYILLEKISWLFLYKRERLFYTETISPERGGGIMRGRQSACCFTGHRPGKLPWRYREEDSGCISLKRRIDADVDGDGAVSSAGLERLP